MPSHHNCHCKRCSTGSSKRATEQSDRPTVKTLTIRAGDIFPVLKIPSRIISLAKHALPTMPALVHIEKADSFPKYERGWNYVEERHGRLVMVRNKRDVFDLHRGGWKTRPRKRVPQEIVVVQPEPEPVVDPCGYPGGSKVYIDVNTPRRHSNTDDCPQSPRPRIQVRRPLNAPPSPVFVPRPRPTYVDGLAGRLVKKVPIIDRGAAALARHRRHEIFEEAIYPVDEEDEDESECCHEEELCQPPVEMPVARREPRPYSMPEGENSYWDEDMQAWVVSRRPKVRFE
jgi:hypothetical protein